MMTNLEYYKDEINGLIKELNQGSVCCAIKDGFEVFSKRHLSNYANRPDKFVDWLLEEHKEQVKLNKWEYDFFKIYNDVICGDLKIIDIKLVIDLKEKGHFKGVTDTSMEIKEILENCEVINED